MTAESFQAGLYCRANKPSEEKDEGFNRRVKTVFATNNPQSRSKVVENPQMGNVHRQSVDSIKPLPFDHKPFTSVHRPEPSDMSSLKKHQTEMLTERGKRKSKNK